jgi:hypothetical protein
MAAIDGKAQRTPVSHELRLTTNLAQGARTHSIGKRPVGHELIGPRLIEPGSIGPGLIGKGLIDPSLLRPGLTRLEFIAEG